MRGLVRVISSADTVGSRVLWPRWEVEDRMSQSEGVRRLAWLDCAGGGQVAVDGQFAFIGHMEAPHGTSVVDVADPRNPRIVAEIDIPPGLHSHKVRVANGIMVVNREHHHG